MKYLIAVLAFFAFLAQAHAITPEEQKSEIQNMAASALEKLYAAQPGTKEKVADAVGYAVFSSPDGHGIARNNRSKQETYMWMNSFFGVKAEDVKVILVFREPGAYRNFVRTGLDLTGQVDDPAPNGTQDVVMGVTAYQLTQSGLIKPALLKGTRYTRDEGLSPSKPVAGAKVISRSGRYN